MATWRFWAEQQLSSVAGARVQYRVQTVVIETLITVEVIPNQKQNVSSDALGKISKPKAHWSLKTNVKPVFKKAVKGKGSC